MGSSQAPPQCNLANRNNSKKNEHWSSVYQALRLTCTISLKAPSNHTRRVLAIIPMVHRPEVTG